MAPTQKEKEEERNHAETDCECRRSSHEEAMKRCTLKVSAVAALAAVALIPASAVSAAQSAKQQRVMLVQKHRFGAPNGTFVLYALTAGPLEYDSGRLTLAAVERPYVVRGGQRLAVYLAVARLTGKRGTFDLRWRVEFAGAGEGNTIGTGTWSLVRGAGAYTGMTGGGRLATVVTTQHGFTTAQFEGLLRASPTTQ
jgi:hypothetical protein